MPNELEDRIKTIEERNERVEGDKGWETSMFRRVLITCITYVVAFFYMHAIGADKSPLGALIPTGGYFLSTLTIPSIKRWWLKRR